MLPIHYQTIVDGIDVSGGWLAHPLILRLLQKSRAFSRARVNIIRARLSMMSRSIRSELLWGFVYFSCREVFLWTFAVFISPFFIVKIFLEK